jgi:hypothetical protein
VSPSGSSSASAVAVSPAAVKLAVGAAPPPSPVARAPPPPAAMAGAVRFARNFSERIKAVVWDFDKTVLAIHSYAQRIAAEDVPARSLDDDFVDMAFFKDVVDALRARAVIVYIASFGKYEVIQAYLDRVFPDEPAFTRETISTPATLGVPGLQDGWSVPGGKVPQLLQMTEKYTLKPDAILFFDGACARRAGCRARAVGRRPPAAGRRQLAARARTLPPFISSPQTTTRTSAARTARFPLASASRCTAHAGSRARRGTRPWTRSRPPTRPRRGAAAARAAARTCARCRCRR